MACWSLLGPVDITNALVWLEKVQLPWSRPAYATKPQRLFAVPEGMFGIVDAVLSLFQPDCVAREMMLSRMLPGQSHPLHVDHQAETTWLTRIHVPLVTNPGCWMQFEYEERVHFAAGNAYTFDAMSHHAFGNDGITERVHLIFDLFRDPSCTAT